MIKVSTIMEGGPQGKKKYISNKSEETIIGDHKRIVYTKLIKFT